MGLAGDEQADRTVHGGIDKAIHHYPADHYDWWRGYLGDVPLLDAPGAFGENISTLGLDEENVFLGDRFRLGTALVEVTQARQPCWKLDHRFAAKGVMASVVKTRRSGWYYRVLEPGRVRAGDALDLVDRPYPGWPLASLFGLLIGGEEKSRLADLPALRDRTSVVSGKRVSVSVDLGGLRYMKKQLTSIQKVTNILNTKHY